MLSVSTPSTTVELLRQKQANAQKKVNHSPQNRAQRNFKNLIREDNTFERNEFSQKAAFRPSTTKGSAGNECGSSIANSLSDEISDYEKQRLDNIKKNEEFLRSCGVDFAKTFLDGLTHHQPCLKLSRKREAPKAVSENHVVRRQSARVKGYDPTASVNDKSSDNQKNEAEYLRSAEEMFPKNIIESALKVDGHFHGTVNLAHFEKSNNPSTGCGNSKTWSTAKSRALRMFSSNPNSYFYRHNVPGENQKFGDWSEDEMQLFLSVARTYGCGDQWGLFSSYIPHRVGYQCASYYRQVILPKGLIIDQNYRFTDAGSVVYYGNSALKEHDK